MSLIARRVSREGISSPSSWSHWRNRGKSDLPRAISRWVNGRAGTEVLVCCLISGLEGKKRQVLEFCEDVHAWDSTCTLFSQLLAAWAEQIV